MSRRTNGNHYEFVGIRDRGDGVIGPTDLIILRDEQGRRHEYYLGDPQARDFLHGIGLELEDLNGLAWGQAQSRLSYLHHMRCAMRRAEAGDSAGLDAELHEAEQCARMAEMSFDMGKAQKIREMARHHG
jgi:hypothetical protein